MKSILIVLALTSMVYSCGKSKNKDEAASVSNSPVAESSTTSNASVPVKIEYKVSQLEHETCISGKCTPTSKTIYVYSEDLLLQTKTEYRLDEKGNGVEAISQTVYIYDSDKKLSKEIFKYGTGAIQRAYYYAYTNNGNSVLKKKYYNCAYTDNTSRDVNCYDTRTAHDEIILKNGYVQQINFYDEDNVLSEAEIYEYDQMQRISLVYSVNKVHISKEDPVSKTEYLYGASKMIEKSYYIENKKLEEYSTVLNYLDDKGRVIKKEETFGYREIERDTITYID